jgi:hypothetical protein
MVRVPELPSRTPAEPMFNTGRLAARAAGSIDAHAAALNAITNAADTKRNGDRRLGKCRVVVPVRRMDCVPPWKPGASATAGPKEYRHDRHVKPRGDRAAASPSRMDEGMRTKLLVLVVTIVAVSGRGKW